MNTRKALGFVLSMIAVLGLCLPAPVAAQQNLGVQNVVQVVAFSATPAFDASTGGTFVMTLTNNVTSSTLVNGSVGQKVSFIISQDGTGSRTFAWPTNVGGAPVIKAAASSVTSVSLRYDGTVWNLEGQLVLTQIAAYTNATTTFSSVPELGFTAAASRNYTAVCRITWQGSAGTTGPKYQFTGPASPTSVAVGMNSIVTATTVIAASATAFSSAVANSGTVTTATNFTDTVSLGVVNGTTAGVIQLQAAANGAGTLTLAQGSSCIVTAQ